MVVSVGDWEGTAKLVIKLVKLQHKDVPCEHKSFKRTQTERTVGRKAYGIEGERISDGIHRAWIA